MMQTTIFDAINSQDPLLGLGVRPSFGRSYLVYADVSRHLRNLAHSGLHHDAARIAKVAAQQFDCPGWVKMYPEIHTVNDKVDATPAGCLSALRASNT